MKRFIFALLALLVMFTLQAQIRVLKEYHYPHNRTVKVNTVIQTNNYNNISTTTNVIVCPPPPVYNMTIKTTNLIKDLPVVLPPTNYKNIQYNQK